MYLITLCVSDHCMPPVFDELNFVFNLDSVYSYICLCGAAVIEVTQLYIGVVNNERTNNWF